MHGAAIIENNGFDIARVYGLAAERLADPNSDHQEMPSARWMRAFYDQAFAERYDVRESQLAEAEITQMQFDEADDVDRDRLAEQAALIKTVEHHANSLGLKEADSTAILKIAGGLAEKAVKVLHDSRDIAAKYIEEEELRKGVHERLKVLGLPQISPK